MTELSTQTIGATPNVNTGRVETAPPQAEKPIGATEIVQEMPPQSHQQLVEQANNGDSFTKSTPE